MKKNYYKVLGLKPRAGKAEIRRAYVKLARREHPDVNPGDSDAVRRFGKIQEAFRILSDSASKEQYDREGKVDSSAKAGVQAAESHPGGPGSRGWDNILRDLFHGDGEAEPVATHLRGEDIHQVVEISFEESFRSVRKEVACQREIVCGECRGQRFARGAKMKPCPACSGSGLVDVQKGPWKARKICSRCSGGGKLSEELCQGCGGRGRTVVLEKVQVKIPPGSDSGTQIVLPGKGQVGRRGGEDGNLVVTVRVRPHPVLERKGYNLFASVPVTVSEAALGATIMVPTVRGKATLKIPPGTQCGHQFRLPNRGVPLQGEKKKGDMYVTIRVVIPSSVSEKGRRLFQELEKLYPDNPRVKSE